MAEFLQHLLNALILGGTYALLGIGLTLIFGIMKIVNFTHGELYTYGAYMVFFFRDGVGREFFCWDYRRHDPGPCAWSAD